MLQALRLFVVVIGNTMNSHTEFMQDLKFSTNCREAESKDESDVIIAFVPIVSRAGTDIEAALAKIPESRPVVLVVLHHTNDPNTMVPESRLSVNDSKIFTVDCLFHEDRGLLRCGRNTEALNKVKDHLKRFRSRDSSPGTDQSDVHTSLLRQAPPFYRKYWLAFVIIGLIIILLIVLLILLS